MGLERALPCECGPERSWGGLFVLLRDTGREDDLLLPRDVLLRMLPLKGHPAVRSALGREALDVLAGRLPILVPKALSLWWRVGRMFELSWANVCAGGGGVEGEGGGSPKKKSRAAWQHTRSEE